MFVAFTRAGGPDNGMKVAVNTEHVDCVMQQDADSTVIYFVGRKEDREKGWFNYLVVSEDFATVVLALNTAGDEMAERMPGEKTFVPVNLAQANPGKGVDDSIEGV